MKSLSEIIVDPESRQAVIADCEVVLEQEIQSKNGFIAYAVKKAFNQVRKLQEGHLIANVFDKLLDEFVEVLEPFEAQWERSDGSQPFGVWLTERSDEVAEALLTVTDRERDRVGNRILVVAYDSLRAPAHKLVSGSVPAVGDLLDKHKRRG